VQVQLWPHQGGYAQKNFEAQPCTFWRKYKAVFVFYASLTGFKRVESLLFHMISMSSREWTCFSQISMSYQECTRAAMVITITICANFSLVNFMLSLSFWLVVFFVLRSSFTKCCYKCTLRKCRGLGVANLINSVSKSDEEKSLHNPKEIMFSCSFSEKIIYQVAKICPKNNTEQHTRHWCKCCEWLKPKTPLMLSNESKLWN